ncbi:MAG: VOC family protein [Salaquimonas sp.]|nr:VOC family protein [Salaquimonas sp.]
MAGVTGLNHITLAVGDVERSFEFCTRLLGFEPVALWDKGAYLQAGDVWLALVLDREGKLSARADYSHIALSSSHEDFEEMVTALEEKGVKAWSQNVSEGASWYFLDPDGHKLELHVGDLQTRLKAMRDNPWSEIHFFAD